jgi:hypothetical protein
LVDRKLQILAERAGKEILQRGVVNLELYDDGRHGDEKPNDGIYANSFTDTKIPGSYTFRFVASDILVGDIKTTREWTKSWYNEVNINPDYSVVDVNFIESTADGWRYRVTIVPRDQFGNYLGPGHPVMAAISHPAGKRQVQLTDDNIYGIYTKEIFISQDEIEAGAKVEIDVDGKKFTTVEKLPSYGKWSASIHSGIAVPIGSFADNFDPGLNVLLDLDYHFSPKLSLVGFFGYNTFGSKTAGDDNNYWLNFSANMKYRLIKGALSPYLQVGPGYYLPKEGDSGFGANLGLGINYDYRSFITLELGADYHIVFGKDTQFLHSHAGVIFRF